MAPLAPIAAVAMAPDASWAVTVSADGTVLVAVMVILVFVLRG